MKLILGLTLAGFSVLLLEVRHEHRVVLGETWRAWIPLACAAAILLLGATALVRWTRALRRALAAAFCAAIAAGLLGMYFHGGPKAVRRILRSWTLRPGEDGGTLPGADPPPLAPLAFCGLGAVGFLACRERFAP
jgi:hypothetical protein